MPKRKKREEDSPLQVAALLCIVIGAAQLATTHSGLLELVGGYTSGIIFIAAGVTLFAFDRVPEESLQILKAILRFPSEDLQSISKFCQISICEMAVSYSAYHFIAASGSYELPQVYQYMN